MTVSLTNLGLNFALNLAVVFVIVRFIYYPRQRNRDYVFTFFAFNTIIFFVMGLLNDTELSIGVGFGLFAIFSILRYRTDTVPIHEMTYLFVLIALAVVNALLLHAEAHVEFLMVNAAVIAILYALEKEWGFHYELRKSITYERIDMIRPENRDLLIADLQERTGLPISRLEIGRIDFLRDSAEILVYYDPRALRSDTLRFINSVSSVTGHHPIDS